MANAEEARISHGCFSVIILFRVKKDTVVCKDKLVSNLP